MRTMLFFTMCSNRYVPYPVLTADVFFCTSPSDDFEIIRPQTQGDAWFKPSGDNVAVGVCIRVDPGQFRVFPYENHYLVPFEAAVRTLNPAVAVKMRSAAVHAALATMSVALWQWLFIQVVNLFFQ